MSALPIAAEIITEVQDQLLDADIRVVGGVGTFAITHSEEIDVPNREVWVAPDKELSVRRPNGTTRDLDILLLQPDQELADEVEAVAKHAARGRMVISLSRTKKVEEYRSNPQKCQHLVDTETGAHIHKVGPFEAQIQDELLAPWVAHQEDGESLPLLDPAFHHVSYYIRRIRGVHEKDLAGGKLQALAERLGSVEGMLSEDGHIHPRLLGLDMMARRIHTIRELSLLQATRRYGSLALRAKLGGSLANSERVVRYYQRREERQLREQ